MCPKAFPCDADRRSFRPYLFFAPILQSVVIFSCRCITHQSLQPTSSPSRCPSALSRVGSRLSRLNLVEAESRVRGTTAVERKPRSASNRRPLSRSGVKTRRSPLGGRASASTATLVGCTSRGVSDASAECHVRRLRSAAPCPALVSAPGSAISTADMLVLVLMARLIARAPALSQSGLMLAARLSVVDVNTAVVSDAALSAARRLKKM